ncbi:MAG: response regulator transcription factor [Saprospiraceae bacterium]|nr:response regulator transcription factor [Saprospiraceae bacterium]
MKALIVDDERYCTDVLTILLQKHCPDVEISGIFNRPEEALEALPTISPDLVFLDIEMPHISGFEFLRRLDKLAFRVIFTTAYDQYALKAFRFNAIDYLLKPIDKDELKAAVNKVKVVEVRYAEKVRAIQNVDINPVPDRILLPIGQEIHFVQVDQIMFCEADGSYCKIYCANEIKPYILSKNLREIEETLNNPRFFRPHTSWLVNDSHIRRLIRGEGMEMVMSNGTHIPISRSKRQEVQDRLGF